MTEPAVHLCRVCGSETVEHNFTTHDGTRIVSHRCYCGFIEPAPRASAARPSISSVAALSEDQSGYRPMAVRS